MRRLPAPLRTTPRAPARGTTGLAHRGEEDAFLTWLFAGAGLSARHYRPTALRRRLPACLRALRVENLAEARRALRRNAQLIPVALDALLLGVTEFFRDPPVYACLERELPSLFLPTAGRLRVWSAGCSDGAELYSVAMLLAELGALGRCELLGTDCRPEAITRAGAGVFARQALRGMSADCLGRFFALPPTHQSEDGAARPSKPGAQRGTSGAPDDSCGAGIPACSAAQPQDPRASGTRQTRMSAPQQIRGSAALRTRLGLASAPSSTSRDPDRSLRVSAALRARVTWRRADAVAAPEPGPWHLVLCRNMGMYLQPAAAERLWRGLASVLGPGGLLVLGKAERPAGAAAGLVVPVGPCVYRRHCGGLST